MKISVALTSCLIATAVLCACDRAPDITEKIQGVVKTVTAKSLHTDWRDKRVPFKYRMAAATEERATHQVTYDAAYERIPYPNGDVSAFRGVCADEVIRAYRLLGIDLQKLVHEDMNRSFAAYPKRWGLKSPDSNIDHRRVPNLATFFTRHGASLPVTDNPDDYEPGDVVAWDVGGGLPHIGIVTERRSDDGVRPLVLHNIGMGPQIEDRLLTFKITGHFRYEGPRANS